MIKNAGSGLKQALLADFKHHYPELSNNIAAEDIIKDDNVLGVDIGEGTTDLVTILNGEVNTNASSSLPKGYGNVLQSAVEVLQAQQMNFDNRAQLKDYLSLPASPFAKKHQEKIRKVVYIQLEPFADQIINAISAAVRQSGAGIELPFDYGGSFIIEFPIMNKIAEWFNQQDTGTNSITTAILMAIGEYGITDLPTIVALKQAKMKNLVNE